VTVLLAHISAFHHTCQQSYYFHPLFNDGFTPLKGISEAVIEKGVEII
jgi:hypothetical protein